MLELLLYVLSPSSQPWRWNSQVLGHQRKWVFNCLHHFTTDLCWPFLLLSIPRPSLSSSLISPSVPLFSLPYSPSLLPSLPLFPPSYTLTSLCWSLKNVNEIHSQICDECMHSGDSWENLNEIHSQFCGECTGIYLWDKGRKSFPI